jgi:hypothetical protein
MNLLAKWMHPRHARNPRTNTNAPRDFVGLLQFLSTVRRRIDRRGYVRVTVPWAEHGWEYEHRLIMERVLGRRLGSTESVHHKNERKDDNRLANLEVIALSDHVAMHNRSRRTAKGPARNTKAAQHAAALVEQCGAN